MTRSTVLVLGDPDLQQLLYRYFEAEYAYLEVPDDPKRLQIPRDLEPDMILLAVPTSPSDGERHIERIREITETPLIILSANPCASARVEALSRGADDYVVRPLDCRELAARIQAVLRRTHMPACNRRIRRGELEISLLTRQARLEGKVLPLAPKEFDLLWELAAHPGQPMSREQLIQRIWKGSYRGSVRTVDSHIDHLRTTLGEYGHLIATVWRVGYRFVDPSEEK